MESPAGTLHVLLVRTIVRTVDAGAVGARSALRFTLSERLDDSFCTENAEFFKHF